MSLFIIAGTVAKILNKRLMRKVVLQHPLNLFSREDETSTEDADLSLLSVK